MSFTMFKIDYEFVSCFLQICCTKHASCLKLYRLALQTRCTRFCSHRCLGWKHNERVLTVTKTISVPAKAVSRACLLSVAACCTSIQCSGERIALRWQEDCILPYNILQDFNRTRNFRYIRTALRCSATALWLG